jgi:hypothetical protein
MTLIYVGPTRVPSGSLSATITLGNTGTEYIEASVKEENIPENDLYCFYPFSGNALDVSGNNHHATVYGPQLTTDRFGKPQSAYSFDGVDDYIISGVMEDFPGNNSSKSVTGWFRSSVVNPYIMMLFGFGNSQHEYNFQGGIGPDYMSGGTVFRLNGWDDNADWRIGTLALEYLDGAWHFCAFTYDGDTAKFYLDGKLQNKTINYNYNTNSNQSRIIIGREIDLSGWEFRGDIDDVRVYSKEISETEVQALYNDKP